MSLESLPLRPLPVDSETQGAPTQAKQPPVPVSRDKVRDYLRLQGKPEEVGEHDYWRTYVVPHLRTLNGQAYKDALGKYAAEWWGPDPKEKEPGDYLQGEIRNETDMGKALGPLVGDKMPRFQPPDPYTMATGEVLKSAVDLAPWAVGGLGGKAALGAAGKFSPAVIRAIAALGPKAIAGAEGIGGIAGDVGTHTASRVNPALAQGIPAKAIPAGSVAGEAAGRTAEDAAMAALFGLGAAGIGKVGRAASDAWHGQFPGIKLPSAPFKASQGRGYRVPGAPPPPGGQAPPSRRSAPPPPGGQAATLALPPGLGGPPELGAGDSLAHYFKARSPNERFNFYRNDKLWNAYEKSVWNRYVVRGVDRATKDQRKAQDEAINAARAYREQVKQRIDAMAKSGAKPDDILKHLTGLGALGVIGSTIAGRNRPTASRAVEE